MSVFESIDKLAIVDYAIEHIDREVYAFRPDGDLVYANRLAKARFHLPDDFSDVFIWEINEDVTPDSWPEKVRMLRET